MARSLSYHSQSATSTPSNDDAELDARVRSELLEVLADRETPVTIDELVDHFAESEIGTDEDDLTVWSEIHERLYRVDLPSLDADGALAFDPVRGLVDESARNV